MLLELNGKIYLFLTGTVLLLVILVVRICLQSDREGIAWCLPRSETLFRLALYTNDIH